MLSSALRLRTTRDSRHDNSIYDISAKLRLEPSVHASGNRTTHHPDRVAKDHQEPREEPEKSIGGIKPGAKQGLCKDKRSIFCATPGVAPSLTARHLPLMNPSRRPILKMGVLDIGVETVALPNGSTLELPIIRHPGASAIVALDRDGTIAMLTQYRHAVGGWHREIPAGCRNEIEEPLECAVRELREETGLTAERWDHLGAIVTIPSFCDERIELFLARDLIQQESHPEPDEIIRIERVSFDEALAMIRRGDITDAKTIAAIHHAQAFLFPPTPGSNRA